MDNDSFYKRSENVKDTNRTYVPNVYREMAAEMYEEQQSLSNEKAKPRCVVELQDRPLVGVLYSISAGIEGDLFPIYIGRNSIGSDPSCDICLRETTVSAKHGLILARKQTDENGNEFISVFLSDEDSLCGTSINGERLGYERVVCNNGDFIQVGHNYVLLLALFQNTENLSVAQSFEAISEDENAISAGVPEQNELSPETNNIAFPNIEDDSEAWARWHSLSPNTRASMDFYKPSKKNDKKQDHYNNETIIL